MALTPSQKVSAGFNPKCLTEGILELVAIMPFCSLRLDLKTIENMLDKGVCMLTKYIFVCGYPSAAERCQELLHCLKTEPVHQ